MVLSGPKDMLYWNGQLVWTPALSTLFVGDCIQRELSPTSALFAVSSHANFFYLQSVPTRSFIYFGWLGLALYNIVVRIMVRVDVRVRVTQG